MGKENTIQNIEKTHPFPHQVGVRSLFRYYKFNHENLLHCTYLKHLLEGNLLYHSLPESFNDPFECRPHWQWPESSSEVRSIRTQLYRIAKAQGESNKEAKRFSSMGMRDTSTLEEAIRSSATDSFRNIRICSFSTSNTNILLWAHYADSHRGMCVEFDALKLPIATSMKVRYQDEYPHLKYPVPENNHVFEIVLTKSSHWSYEEEFRSILIPKAVSQLKNDGESYYLPNGTISNIYFGVAMTTQCKERILEILAKSSFTPNIWQAQLSNNSYSITFHRVDDV